LNDALLFPVDDGFGYQDNAKTKGSEYTLGRIMKTAPTPVRQDQEARWWMSEKDGAPEARLDRVALAKKLEQLAAFRRTVERLPFGVNIVRIDQEDLSGSRFLFLNEEAWKQGNVDPDDWVGHTFGEAMPDALDLPDDINFPKAYARVVASGESEVLKIVYGQANMPESVFNLHCVPLGDDLCALVYENITERVRATMALEQRTEELARSNQELEQFAYAASHDLQTPLRTITGFSRILGNELADTLDPRHAKFFKLVESGVDQMQDIIQDLLALARIGQQPREPEQVALADALAAVAGTLSESMEQSGATLEHDVEGTVCAISSLLKQLLQNLIENAIKYRNPDVAPRIQVALTTTDEYDEVAVADNGPGIEPKFHERVFQIFKRVKVSGYEPAEGTGIGLAVCKKIVELHGGRIWVDPDESEGATIRFTLPRNPTTGDQS